MCAVLFAARCGGAAGIIVYLARIAIDAPREHLKLRSTELGVHRSVGFVESVKQIQELLGQGRIVLCHRKSSFQSGSCVSRVLWARSREYRRP